MKKIILLLVGAGLWLWGYSLGQRPGSPDVLGWLGKQARSFQKSEGGQMAGQAFEAAKAQVDALLAPKDSPDKSAAPATDDGAASTKLADRTPPAGQSAAARPAAPRQDDSAVPDCW